MCVCVLAQRLHAGTFPWQVQAPVSVEDVRACVSVCVRVGGDGVYQEGLGLIEVLTVANPVYLCLGHNPLPQK